MQRDLYVTFAVDQNPQTNVHCNANKKTRYIINLNVHQQCSYDALITYNCLNPQTNA